MPQPSVTQIRLNNITTYLTITSNTLHVLASSLKGPFLEAISNTTQSLLQHIQNDCTELLEQTYQLLNAIMMVHIKSDTGGELPPSVLNHIGKFTETLHKIHTFVEAQQVGNKVKNFFRQGEMSRLLNECKAGLRQGFDIFEVNTLNIMNDITKMQEDVEKRHKEVLDMIEAFSDRTSSDGASSVCSKLYLNLHATIQTKILHGEHQNYQTSFIFSVKDHPGYEQQHFFVACDSVATQVELAALIGTHLGLKPGKDLTRPVIQHFSSSPHSLLILDNLETLWEPTDSRANIEEFLSLLTDAELLQAKLPIDNILGCKAALIRTTLAYSDEHKQLKVLVPVREYMWKNKPPGYHLVRPLLKHFKELLELCMEYHGTQSSSATVARISSNYSNIQNILWNGAHQGHPDLVNTIYCACDLNSFSRLAGRGAIPFTTHIPSILPQPCDHHLEAYYIIKMLVSEALEHFKHFDDLDLKCRLYNALSEYYSRNSDLSTAKDVCETSISLALSAQNTKMQSRALSSLARINWQNGDYFTAQGHTNKAQRLARIVGDLYSEAQALCIGSMCCNSLGNYKQSISLCSRARDLLALCGMSSGQLDHFLMITQAEIHKCKSEYVEARNIHFRILQETSVIQDPYTYGIASLNVAEIDVTIGAPKEDVQSVYEKAREIFCMHNLAMHITMCDTILADLYLREQNLLEAKTLFERCLILYVGHSEIMSYCLERLGNASCWDVANWMSGWTTVFLVHSVKQKEKLGIHKALQFLGDTFLAQNEEHTAISLFTVALDGFTQMDVHCSRAECMLRLGDISKGEGNLLKAVELWETARPLFERSMQAKRVENIDQRLAGVSEDVLEQHRKNLACLAELNAPSGTVDEINNLSDIEDTEGLHLEDETTLDPVAL
ncbi:hypothetical protein B0H13DRAFT_1911075 [Mycena leptocephala]|nr:hypothetical protein B0H13DRAFT_1911075 [Mycena leptocephala]